MSDQACMKCFIFSSQMHPNSIHITAVVVRWTTTTGRLQKGVATNWLATKKVEGYMYSSSLTKICPEYFTNRYCLNWVLITFSFYPQVMKCLACQSLCVRLSSVCHSNLLLLLSWWGQALDSHHSVASSKTVMC